MAVDERMLDERHGGIVERPGRVTSPVTIGRDHELAALTDALKRRPRLCLLLGEPGIGKSRLVRDVCDGAALGTPVVVGACQPLLEPLPLAPIVAALRSLDVPLLSRLRECPLSGVLRPLVPELAEWLAPPPPTFGASRPERHLMLRAAAEALRALSPVVLVLEDLHWADDATVDLLTIVLADPAEHLAILATARPEIPGGVRRMVASAGKTASSVQVTRIQLEPLSASDVKMLISLILHVDEVTDEFASFVHAHTGGIPFAVEELLQLLQDRRDLVRRGDRWARRHVESLRPPAAISDSIRERVAGLSPDAVLVLHAAAVLREASGESLLARVAGLDVTEAEMAIAELVRAGMLEEREGLTQLRHALARQAVLEAIPRAEQRVLHRRAADVLERDAPAALARLAYHLESAGDGARWVRAAEAAAAEARRLGNPAAAVDFLTGPLRSAAMAPEHRFRVLEEVVAAALDGDVHRDVVELVRAELNRQEWDRRRRGQLRLLLASLYRQDSDIDGARQQWAAAVRDLEDDPAAATQALVKLAFHAPEDVRLTTQLRLMSRAVALSRRSRDPLLSMSTDIDAAILMLAHGATEAAGRLDALPWERRDQAAAGELVRAALNAARVFVWQGHVPSAARYLERAEALATGTVRVASVTSVQALMAWMTGDWARLDEILPEALKFAQELPHVHCVALAVDGTLQIARGRVDEGLKTLGTARTLSVGSPIVQGFATVAAAERALDRRRPAEAIELTMPVVAFCRTKGTWLPVANVLSVTAEALAAAGREPDATALLEEVGDELSVRDWPAPSAELSESTGRLAARTGDLLTARESLTDAVGRWEAARFPYRAALARARLGDVEIAAGEPARAGDLLRRAYRDLSALGASGAAARVARAMRKHGLSTGSPYRGGRRGYGNELSPRETEVATLVAGGLTNGEIAERLFLSEHTVAHHVANAMRKSGVESRRQLRSPDAARASVDDRA